MKQLNVNMFFYTALIIILILNNVVFAAGGVLPGAGSESNPYLIEDFTDFQTFADPNYASQYWSERVYTKLMCNIDLDPSLLGRQSYTSAIIAFDLDNTNLSFEGTFFSGVFDGNGYIINNLTINTSNNKNDFLGLFGDIERLGAEIKNLGLENVNIIGGKGGKYLGALCGNCEKGGIVRNCYSTGSITGGINSMHLGGLCGYIRDGSINNCYSFVFVTGGENSSFLGGLCGVHGEGNDMSNCFSRGFVIGGDYSYNLGGLCGWNWGQIENSYSASSVMGTGYVGGLCGENFRSIANCYSKGTVSGDSYVGGLCGRNMYSGYSVNCFWDVETSSIVDWEAGSIDTDGMIGLATSQMQIKSTFTDYGWDFADVWDIAENQTYPFLRFYVRGDLNKDAVVNLQDFAIFADYWLVGR